MPQPPQSNRPVGVDRSSLLQCDLDLDYVVLNFTPCFSRYALALAAASFGVSGGGSLLGLKCWPSSSTITIPLMLRPSIMSRIAGTSTLPSPRGQYSK